MSASSTGVSSARTRAMPSGPLEVRSNCTVSPTARSALTRAPRAPFMTVQASSAPSSGRAVTTAVRVRAVCFLMLPTVQASSTAPPMAVFRPAAGAWFFR